MTSSPLRIPLLRDRHTHPLLYAALLENGVDLNADPAETRDQAIRRIRARARSGGSGWTIAHGWHSGRYPLSKEEFDGLPPVVIFNLSLHGLIVNDAGRALLLRDDPDVADNLDSQAWVERNLRRVLNVFARDGASAGRLRKFFRWLLEEHGVWHAEEMLLVDGKEIELFEEAGVAGRTRFWASPDQYDALPPDILERIHGIKVFTDGALGAWTAALHRPYRDSDRSGMLLFEPGGIESLLDRCRDAGKPVALHAIGDRAIDQVVAAVEAVGGPSENEIRIEHAQFITEATARRAKRLGVRLCMQPNFSDDSIHYTGRLPEGYPVRNNPFRMLIDGAGYVPGKDLLFGSDGMPHGVAEGLRQSLFPPYSGQRLTVEEFVAGYCMPAGGTGCIELRIDPDRRQVTCHVMAGERE